MKSKKDDQISQIGVYFDDNDSDDLHLIKQQHGLQDRDDDEDDEDDLVNQFGGELFVPWFGDGLFKMLGEPRWIEEGEFPGHQQVEQMVINREKVKHDILMDLAALVYSKRQSMATIGATFWGTMYQDQPQWIDGPAIRGWKTRYHVDYDSGWLTMLIEKGILYDDLDQAIDHTFSLNEGVLEMDDDSGLSLMHLVEARLFRVTSFSRMYDIQDIDGAFTDLLISVQTMSEKERLKTNWTAIHMVSPNDHSQKGLAVICARTRLHPAPTPNRHLITPALIRETLSEIIDRDSLDGVPTTTIPTSRYSSKL